MEPEARRSPGRRILALLLGVVLALLLAEGLFWIFDIGPPEIITKRWLIPPGPGVLYHCYPDNPHGELVPVPETTSEWRLEAALMPPVPLPLSRLSETPFCVEYRTSSQGLRDRRYEERPEPGVLRILAVGDSFAVGEGVPIELTLGRHLESLLGDGVQVLNGGRPGANTRDELAILRRLAPRFRCQTALVVFVPNDIELTDALAGRQDFINDLINIRAEELEKKERGAWYVGHSRIARHVGSVLALRKAASRTVEWYRDSYDPAHNGRSLDRLSRFFREMASLAGCRTALVLYPLLEGFNSGGYPLAPVHEEVARRAREAGLPVLDLAPAFSDEDPEQLWVHPVDHHPNGRAHGIAARAIATWLRTEHPDLLEPGSR